MRGQTRTARAAKLPHDREPKRPKRNRFGLFDSPTSIQPARRFRPPGVFHRGGSRPVDFQGHAASRVAGARQREAPLKGDLPTVDLQIGAGIMGVEAHDKVCTVGTMVGLERCLSMRHGRSAHKSGNGQARNNILVHFCPPGRHSINTARVTYTPTSTSLPQSRA